MVGTQEIRALKYLDISASNNHKMQQMAYQSNGALLAFAEDGEREQGIPEWNSSAQYKVFSLSSPTYLVPEALHDYNQSLWLQHIPTSQIFNKRKKNVFMS